jgi:hypothetical protein
VKNGFCLELRNTRSRLIPSLREAKRRGHAAFLKKDKLAMNRRIYELDWLVKNLQLNGRSCN